ncbi:hypothetical protein D9M71_252250 [compost metagenome]
MQHGDVERLPGLHHLDGVLGHFLGHQAADGSVEAVGHQQAVPEDVGCDVQAIAVLASVDAPEHHGDQHFVLGALASREHALDVGGVGRQQLSFQLDLALGGLDATQARSVLDELGELEFVGGQTCHGLGGTGGLRRRLGGGDTLVVAATEVHRGLPHAAWSSMFSAIAAQPRSSIT